MIMMTIMTICKLTNYLLAAGGIGRTPTAGHANTQTYIHRGPQKYISEHYTANS